MNSTISRLHEVFDLAMRIGEVMISNGAAAAEVTATMLRVTASSGIRNVSVQVTLTELSVSYFPDEESTPFTRIRTAAYYSFDFMKLDQVDRITTAYVKGTMDLHEARIAVEKVSNSKPFYSNLVTTLAWVVMGGACALYFGAGMLVTVFASIAAGVLWQTYILFAKLKFPIFFTQIAGGFMVVMIAILVSKIDPTVNSSLVVVACIVMVLAGATSVGAMQDAITGWYVTAAGRLLETFMLTIGAVIGIRGGMMVAQALGVDISITATLPSNIISLAVVLVAGGLIGLGFAVGYQVPVRLLVWVTVLPALTAGGSFLLGTVGLERPWAVGVTAVITGFVGVIIAQKVQANANILTVSAVATMVPGAVIYRGLLGLSDGSGTGMSNLFLAAEIAIAISSGLIFGELIGSRVLDAFNRGSSRMPVIAAPFSTNRRRRQVSFLRRRRPVPLTAAIPVVHLDPGELDPTIDVEAGPEWREDAENLQPDVRESGFEIQEQPAESIEMAGIRTQ